MNLLPIDSAPKDGREVLLLVAGPGPWAPSRYLVGHYMPGGHCIEDHPPIDAGWYYWNGNIFDREAKPTHWSPLPGVEHPTPHEHAIQISGLTEETFAKRDDHNKAVMEEYGWNAEKAQDHVCDYCRQLARYYSVKTVIDIYHSMLRPVKEPEAVTPKSTLRTSPLEIVGMIAFMAITILIITSMFFQWPVDLSYILK
jgi:hypothetical protein